MTDINAPMRYAEPIADRHVLGPELVSPDRISWWWKRARQMSGINSKWRLHDLRHTHATLALQAGVHPKIVSERLGHSTIAFTLDVYSHAIPHMQIGDFASDFDDRPGCLMPQDHRFAHRRGGGGGDFLPRRPQRRPQVVPGGDARCK